MLKIKSKLWSVLSRALHFVAVQHGPIKKRKKQKLTRSEYAASLLSLPSDTAVRSDQKEFFPMGIICHLYHYCVGCRSRTLVRGMSCSELKGKVSLFTHAFPPAGNYSSIGWIIKVIYLQSALHSAWESQTVPQFPSGIRPVRSHFDPVDINCHLLPAPSFEILCTQVLFVILTGPALGGLTHFSSIYRGRKAARSHISSCFLLQYPLPHFKVLVMEKSWWSSVRDYITVMFACHERHCWIPTIAKLCIDTVFILEKNKVFIWKNVPKVKSWFTLAELQQVRWMSSFSSDMPFYQYHLSIVLSHDNQNSASLWCCRFMVTYRWVLQLARLSFKTIIHHLTDVQCQSGKLVARWNYLTFILFLFG